MIRMGGSPNARAPRGFGPWLRRVLLVALLSHGYSGTTVAAAPGDYALGPGDVVKITVFQNPDLTTETRVSEAGTVTFPLVGQVGAAGQSTTQLEQAIVQKLRDGGFVNRPQVNVVVLQFRALQVSVLGQVNKPGRYPLEQSRNRLTEVVALAGGVTPLAADVVTLVTTDNGKEKKISVDLPELLRSGDLSRDAVIKNGDIIFVDRYPVFYIYGEVQRPGQYRLERGMTVMQALAVGGGLTLRGTERGLRINRRDRNGAVGSQDAKPDEPVLADDVIFVRESMF
jgi:polysaccharide export outer membrane protein